MHQPLRYFRLRGHLGDGGPTWLAELPPGVHRLGSVDDNDLVVRFHGVSRHHLLLRVGETVTVEDLGSKNGTQINGRPRRQGTLEVGDELGVGPVRLRLECAGADDVRLATGAGAGLPVLEAADLELERRNAGPGPLRQLDAIVERLADGPHGGHESLARVAEQLGAGGACWLVWWERRVCLVTASWGADFHGLLELEDLCQRAEARAGLQKTVVLRSSGPPQLTAAVLLARPHPSALLLWDAENPDSAAGGAMARILARLLDRECAALEADAATEGAEPPAPVGWVDGPDPASRRIRVQVADALESTTPILVEGEPGTGKKHVARWIHAADGRSGPMVSAACAELSDAALAQGFRVAAQERGTLLLEAVEKLAPELYEPVLQLLGAAGQHPRLILTRNLRPGPDRGAELPEELERLLRRRIITLEPLRRRREQIPRLVRHMLAQTGGRAGESVRGVTVEAMRRLLRHSWPGNVEELRDGLDRLIRRLPGPTIDVTSLPEAWSRGGEAASGAVAGESPNAGPPSQSRTGSASESSAAESQEPAGVVSATESSATGSITAP